MPVTMSGIDKNTHINFFPNEWQFSVILNPQRKLWAVYNGKECKNCNGIILIHVDEDISGNFEKSTNSSESVTAGVSTNSDKFKSVDTSGDNNSFVIKHRTTNKTEQNSEPPRSSNY